jgi:hypothetical protein
MTGRELPDNSICSALTLLAHMRHTPRADGPQSGGSRPGVGLSKGKTRRLWPFWGR